MPSELLFFSPENTFLCHAPPPVPLMEGDKGGGASSLMDSRQKPPTETFGGRLCGNDKIFVTPCEPKASKGSQRLIDVPQSVVSIPPKIVMSPDFKPGDIISLLLRTTNSFISGPDS